MTLVLHDAHGSTNALKVRILLAELGLGFERVEHDLASATSDQAYREVHPFGLIPALVDGALVVTESNTALRYLAEREQRHDLRGGDPRARARVDGLLDTLSLELRPALWEVERFAIYGEPVDAAGRAARHADLHDALAAFDRLLDPAGPHAIGAFTVADCAIAARLWHLDRLDLAAGAAPRLRRVVAAVRRRPSWAQATAAAGPP